ncbi:cell wall hydrolase SleB [Ammonifex degensii KC4]|uniref:Cell wall hydrolase SleB n=1 Tax=Ammonifex degensii (strain DSM 10501 / KC4) TaxID=429009 RepID=C9R914_AMMDK|nr:cell wall hydrolase [Ammonifex degensii]ACX52793.1 cell wall hydrolase SleB [Ammonifex degensii KC4]
MRRTWPWLLLVLTLTLAGAGKVAAAEKTYTVAAGDTLWRISQAYGITVEELMEENDLDSPIIFPGEVLRIPESRGLKTITSRDLELLARIIHAEARGEEFLGKVAVGAVVLNRLRHPAFPKTVPEVIFQRTNGLYEFTPVADGSINLEPDEEAYAAAREALKGRDPTGGALFFYNPRTATDRWIRTLPVTVRIGNHVFATVKN